METFFNFMRQSLILTLKSANDFVVFKRLPVWLFQIRSPRDDVANLVTLNKILASYSLYLVEYLFFIYLFIHLFIYLFVYQFICLSIYLKFAMIKEIRYTNIPIK